MNLRLGLDCYKSITIPKKLGTNPALFQCPQCNHFTHKRKILKRHTQIKHNKTGKYNCSECQYSGASKWKLGKHAKNVCKLTERVGEEELTQEALDAARRRYESSKERSAESLSEAVQRMTSSTIKLGISLAIHLEF